jgi:p-hydroxybenzoate 3-monooxygenase
MRTQIGIVGAGPAGLVLSLLFHERGIESVILEARSRQYVEQRLRAGVLEHGTVELLSRIGVGSRMQREGLQHHGIELGFQRLRHRVDFSRLTGKSITVYGQHEVVKDLIQSVIERGIPIHFEAENVHLRGIDTDHPHISFERQGAAWEINCDFIAGCDGFHGVSRQHVPQGVLTAYEHTYPFGWLGILAQAAPTQNELVYMHSERGFALFSMRSAAVTRLYLQCRADEDLAEWPDGRIWEELFLRFASSDGWRPAEGPILSKSVTPLRSFVIEPMQFGRLYLAGDAAHIVPPTGAKGLNLAIADVCVLAQGIAAWYSKHDAEELSCYSQRCLRRVWNAQRFSWRMTSLLHLFNASPFECRRQIAELDHVITSAAAAQALAQDYVGLPMPIVNE